MLLATGLLAPSVSEPAFDVGARAAAAAPSAAQTALERFYNPFGDPWELKRPANPNVPVSLTPACHRNDPKRSAGTTAPEIQWLSRSNTRIIFEECGELADIADGQGAALLKASVSAIKAVDPTLKFIGHYTASIMPYTGVLSTAASVSDGEAIGFRFIDQNRESWYVHKKGAPPTRENRLRHVSTFGEIVDFTNPDLRNYLAGKLAESMVFHNVDGVAIDSCHDLPQYNTDIPGNVPPDDVVANWANGCVEFMRALKLANPSKLVFTLNYWSLAGQTAPDHETYDAEWFNRRIAVADGILWEDPIGLQLYPADEIQRSIERLGARLATARAFDKYLGVLVNTNAGNQSSFRSTSLGQQQVYAQYYFAAYLMVLDSPKTLLIYYTPNEAVEQFNTGTFFSVFDADVGLPLGPRQNLSTGVYRREFQKGRAFLNGGDSPLNVSLEDGTYITPGGVPVRTATIPPKSGATFLSAPTSFYCTPRPPVRLQTQVLGNGAIQVQISAGFGEVRRLEIGRAPNTMISVQGGPQQISGNRTIEMPTVSPSAILTLERVAPGAGVFAQMTVTDSCGTWKTFAGRGATP